MTSTRSLPRARAQQPAGDHHDRDSAAAPVCDICPPVLCLQPEVVPGADRSLPCVRHLEEADREPPGTAFMSGVATVTAATGTHCGSLGRGPGLAEGPRQTA